MFSIFTYSLGAFCYHYTWARVLKGNLWLPSLSSSVNSSLHVLAARVHRAVHEEIELFREISLLAGIFGEIHTIVLRPSAFHHPISRSFCTAVHHFILLCAHNPVSCLRWILLSICWTPSSLAASRTICVLLLFHAFNLFLFTGSCLSGFFFPIFGKT